MNKEWFNVKTDNIEVPEEELFLAINKGIEKGRKRKKYKKKTKILVSLTSIAASLILASGFLFSPMTKVMASVPLIGSIYESLHFKMGKQLEGKNLITELNQTASDNGVDITIKSVYYDGVYIGVTFEADGFEVTNSDSDIEYEFYLSEEQGIKVGWAGGIGNLQKVENYYMSAIELEYPDKELPKDFSLPIIFTNMGGVDGKWQFDIPVTQLPLKTYIFESTTSQDENYSFTMESMVIGESNMRIHYITTIPMDLLNFKIIDDNGNELSENTQLSLGSDSAVFETGIGETDYLLFYPIYLKDGILMELKPLKVNVQHN